MSDWDLGDRWVKGAVYCVKNRISTQLVCEGVSAERANNRTRARSVLRSKTIKEECPTVGKVGETRRLEAKG